MGPICLFSLAAAGVAFACGPSALRAEQASRDDSTNPALVGVAPNATARKTAAPLAGASRTATSVAKKKAKKNNANERRRKNNSATATGGKDKSQRVGGKRATISPSSGRSEKVPVPRTRPPGQNADAKPSAPAEEAARATGPWSTDEVLAARARCVELLAPISADVSAGPAVRAGACGTPAPVVVESIGTSVSVAMRPPVSLNCSVVVALHAWLEQNVQPAARDLLGEEITAVSGTSGYQCRNRADTARISEHGFANAIDILGFVTRSGRRVSVINSWGPNANHLSDKNNATAEAARSGVDDHASTDSGRRVQRHAGLSSAVKEATAERRLGKRSRSSSPTSPLPGLGKSASASPASVAREAPPEGAEHSPELRFLKRIHREACSPFTTVLGPDANEDHRDHFHLDLAKRRHDNSYCR